MTEAISFILGMIAMAVVWFINDMSPSTSLYARGYVEGYKDAMKKYKKERGDGMKEFISEHWFIIIGFILPFCFGFIINRAGRNGDTAMVVVAIIGILADAVLILTRG